MSLYRHPVVSLWCCGENEIWTQREEEKRLSPLCGTARLVTYWYWSASQSISICLIWSHIQLCPESSMFQSKHLKAVIVWSAHIWVTVCNTQKKYCLGTPTIVQCVRCFMCTIHFSLSKCLKSLGWECYSLCYNMSICGEDECVLFFTPPPSSVLYPH